MNLQSRLTNKTVDLVACDKCNCTWMYRAYANRYSSFPVSLAQDPRPVHFEADFPVLVCLGCGEVVFPPIEGFQTESAANKLRQEMVEEVTGSKEVAEDKIKGTKVQKTTKGVWGHIPTAADHDDLYIKDK